MYLRARALESDLCLNSGSASYPLGDLLAIYSTSLSLSLCYLKIWDKDMYLI